MEIPRGTVENLRADIDAGRTRDKVAGHDPAVVPLGADEEAGGKSVSPELASMARNQEVDAPADDRNDGGSGVYFCAIAAIAVLLGTGAVLVR